MGTLAVDGVCSFWANDSRGADNLIEASDATLPGQAMQMGMWGHADSIPPKVDQGICDVSLRSGFVATGDDSFGLENAAVNGTSLMINGTQVDLQRRQAISAVSNAKR